MDQLLIYMESSIKLYGMQHQFEWAMDDKVAKAGGGGWAGLCSFDAVNKINHFKHSRPKI